MLNSNKTSDMFPFFVFYHPMGNSNTQFLGEINSSAHIKIALSLNVTFFSYQLAIGFIFQFFAHFLRVKLKIRHMSSLPLPKGSGKAFFSTYREGLHGFYEGRESAFYRHLSGGGRVRLSRLLVCRTRGVRRPIPRSCFTFKLHGTN